jgi:hypothetical protein
MAKTIGILGSLMAIAFLSSFADNSPTELIGTYGVSESNPSRIMLTLHSDSTYYYQDFSIADRKVVQRGNWKSRGNRVLLMESGSNKKVYEVWTISGNGQVAKCRNGLAFYRLCRMGE